MRYEQAIAQLLSRYMDIPENEILASIETPASPALGHFAFPCFKLAKTLKKAPPLIAKELAEKITDDTRPAWLEKTEAAAAYINFFLDRSRFARDILEEIGKEGEGYGASGMGKGKRILVEFSSPNIAKHFHIGHFGNTVLGHSLYNIFNFLGYDVTGINHLGDWGTQFGKLITAYLKWGSREEIEKTEIDGLTRLYVRFHEEAEKDKSLEDEARAWGVKMENGDGEGLSLWRWFIDLSMREFNRIYERLNVRFDIIRGESYYMDKQETGVQLLKEKGLLTESEGAQIVDLEKYGMPPCLILRSDGGTLYATRDIPTAIDRYENFKFDKCLYVVGNEQALYFSQWMKIIELLGYPWAKDLAHVAYGLFSFDSGKMSTRRGEVIKAEDVINEAVSKTLAVIKEKNPALAGKEAIAEQVGIGALIFNRLYNNRIKDTVFSWERMLNFEGETGPYVQYTHARACSILEKAGGETEDFNVDGTLLAESEAFLVLRILYEYPKKIKEAADKYEPFIIARFLMALAQAFNSFYHNHIVLVDEPERKKARLALTRAVRRVLSSGLALLGIAAPQRM